MALIEQHKSNKSRYVALFLPGFPGEYRERELTNDLVKLGFDIYSVKYPGTYDAKGVFSPASVTKSIKTSLNKLKQQNKPILMITYSFSTYFVLDCLNSNSNFLGVIFFSPILDLKLSISNDFLKHLTEYDTNKKFNIDYKGFSDFIASSSIDYLEKYKGKLKKVTKNRYPLIFAIGNDDKGIKVNMVKTFLNSYRKKHGFNKLFVMDIDNTHHKLDSLYKNHHIYKFIAGIVFSNKVEEKYPDINIYTWGALLNYKYSNEKSDIDMILIDKEFSLSDYVFLNKLVNQFNSKFSVTVDIIVNTHKELQSKERIRSNRGPSFIHELQYYYFPLLVNDKLKLSSTTKKDIQKDALRANYLNIYISKKALLNYPPGSTASNWIMKIFIIGCYYHQYLLGNLYPDQNNIEDYYKKTDKLTYNQILKIKEIKKNNYKGVTLGLLKKLVINHQKLFSSVKKFDRVV